MKLIGAAIALATSSLPLEVVALVAIVSLVVQFGSFDSLPGSATQLRDAPALESVAADHPGRHRDGALLHGRHGRVHLGPLFLKNVFDETPSKIILFALAVFPYLLSSGGMRLAGDTLVAKYGAVTIRRASKRAGSSGALANRVVFAPAWPVAVLGF